MNILSTAFMKLNVLGIGIVTKSIPTITPMVTTAQGVTLIKSIITVIAWAVRIYIAATSITPLQEWWDAKRDGDERGESKAKGKLIQAFIILVLTIVFEAGVKLLIDNPPTLSI